MNLADKPKSLGKTGIREARLKMLDEAHIGPLTQFVYDLRRHKGLTNEVPFFDPMDGGINAKVLFVLEAPGPKAVASGFISRNNPDETAKNMFMLLEEAGFERKETLLWNIVPWYIGSGQKIRPANNQDIAEGLVHLIKLTKKIQSLESIVLVGKKAAQVKGFISDMTTIPIFESYHPSPMFVNNKPENRNLILSSFVEIRKNTSR